MDTYTKTKLKSQTSLSLRTIIPSAGIEICHRAVTDHQSLQSWFFAFA